MIRVLVVEDSPVARDFLIQILDRTPDIRVVGTAADGEEAIKAMKRLRPDLITPGHPHAETGGLGATAGSWRPIPLPS